MWSKLKRKLRKLFVKTFIKHFWYFTMLERQQNEDIFKHGDYVRFSEIETLCHEIDVNEVPGAIAELGVYKGKTAAMLNVFCPERQLHLFDTFDGFDIQEAAYDRQHGFSTGEEDFSNTSVDMVLGKMQDGDRVTAYVGLFGDTKRAVEKETFAFVSLDVDLANPTMEGLEFFWPRLSKGGYIVVHDFYNREYTGVMTVVKAFCYANGIPYFPLCDFCGSVVIGK